MALTKEEELMIDHQKARDYIDEYKTFAVNQIIKRGQILNGAIQDFNTFRDVPPSDNLGAAIWDFAFGLLSAAVPALRLGEFFKKQYERASVALKAAESFGQQARRADKVVKVVSKGLETGGTIVKHIDDAKGILEKAEKISPAAKDLSSHVSRKPIFELIRDLDDAMKAWEKTREAETKEWENRLADLPPQGGTLKDKVKGMLQLPEQFSESDLNQIWTLYLYLMVGEHCKRNVKWVVTDTDYGFNQHTRETDFDGLNDNQRNKIVEWFGMGAQRGKYFYKPPILYVWNYLEQFPIPTETRHKRMDFDIRGKV